MNDAANIIIKQQSSQIKTLLRKRSLKILQSKNTDQFILKHNNVKNTPKKIEVKCGFEQQNLPQVNQRYYRRHFKQTNSNEKNKNNLKTQPLESNYHTEKVINSRNYLKSIQIIRKSFNQQQKTVPIGNTILQNTNFIKQIIKKSKTRKNLVEKISQIKKKTIGHNQLSIKQQKITLYNTNHKIQSCKQMNLFRINSRKLLKIDKSNQSRHSQQQSNSLSKIYHKQQKNLVNRKKLQESLQSLNKHRTLKIRQKLKQNQNVNSVQQNQGKNTPFQENFDDISQIKQISLASSMTSFSHDIPEVPIIDCQMINNSKLNYESFLRSQSKNSNINAEKSYLRGIEPIEPSELKRLMHTKNRKKIIQVQKLRKKFPTDFFNI